MRLLDRLAEPFAERLAELGGDPAPGSLAYRPAGPVGAEAIAAELGARRARDLERTQTGAGPHLDDFGFVDRHRDVRAYGSQGEQRTAVLALLLAEADLVLELRGLRPVLLLDDVASELDADRRTRLLAAVRARGQAVVTTTHGADVADAAELLVRVERGVARAA
jgi:DNA replication and repair protein RecF